MSAPLISRIEVKSNIMFNLGHLIKLQGDMKYTFYVQACAQHIVQHHTAGLAITPI